MDYGISILDSMLIEMTLGTQFNNVSGGGSITVAHQLPADSDGSAPRGGGGDPMLDDVDKDEPRKKMIKRHY